LGFLEGDQMSLVACTVLVVAKAPVAGQAKTRLAREFGPVGAAELAAASLLDTLIAVRSADVSLRVVALTGDLSRACRGAEIELMLSEFTVITQRGLGLGERLVGAHSDAAALDASPVFQIGMDTPQIGADLLMASAESLIDPVNDAVLGPANDGGWWGLGVSQPEMASMLSTIEMSRADTGAKTLAALQEAGNSVLELPVLTDVDTSNDVWHVANELHDRTHFRQAVMAICRP
jgi:glycosyltransferase A (GT-A) superfamily protein (DUF2064 family)